MHHRDHLEKWPSCVGVVCRPAKPQTCHYTDDDDGDDFHSRQWTRRWGQQWHWLRLQTRWTHWSPKWQMRTAWKWRISCTTFALPLPPLPRPPEPLNRIVKMIWPRGKLCRLNHSKLVDKYILSLLHWYYTLCVITFSYGTHKTQVDCMSVCVRMVHKHPNVGQS